MRTTITADGGEPVGGTATHRGDPTDASGAGTADTVSDGRPAGPRLFYPEYGALEALLGLWLAAVLFEAVTPGVVDAVAAAGVDATPAAVRTAAASFLWLLAGVVVLTVVLRQFRENPRSFEAADDRAAFLAAHRPTATHFVRAVALLVAGATVVALAWDVALETFRSVVPLVVDPATGPSTGVTVLDGATMVAFVLGFAAYARGFDRVVVGLAREALHQHYRADRTA